MRSEKRMFFSFILNFFFTIIEFIGGIITNSVALISDSIHDLGDSFSMAIAIILEKKSKQKPDDIYTYGYRRFSLLGALLSSVVLIIGSTFVVIEAINRLIHPEIIDSELLIYFAIFGVIVNGIAAFNISKGHSMNERVITLHLIEDVVGWITLFIGAMIMHFTRFMALDAILSLGFTLFIVIHVFKNLQNIFKVLLERAPGGYSLTSIKKTLISVEKVVDIHHLHLWSLEGQTPLITLHAVLVEGVTTEEISVIQHNLLTKLKEIGIKHATIQVELKSTACLDENCVLEEELKIGNHHHHH